MAFSKRFKSLSIAALLTALPLTASLAHTPKATAGTGYLHHYHLVDKESGKCLGTYDGSHSPDTVAIMWTCNANNDQKWSSLGDGKLLNADYMCLSVYDNSVVETTFVVISNCGANNVQQKWTIYPDGAISLGSTRLFLSATGRENNHDPVILYHPLNNGSQNWRLDPVD